ncbi:hypothetical protein [Streptomyces sp. NPDC059639]|uniref:hypothetical protein n=1 Tax=Streptomyces sp. NPDC059639 TaxID=3346891 RepID=UPI0036AFF78E
MSARRMLNGSAPGEALELLPMAAVHLMEIPGLTETARAIGTDRNIDYLVDREVAAMLHRHRRLLSRMNTYGVRGGLLFAPGAVGAWFLIDSAADRDSLDPVVVPIVLTPVALLLAVGVYLLIRAFWCRRAWIRGGTRDQVNGYLQILSEAGLPIRQLPPWLAPFTGMRWR